MPKTKIPFTKEYKFEYGKLEQVSPLIRRVTAKNPGNFTFNGTGTYIIGKKGCGGVAVVDPGPLQPDHIDALKELLQGETVTHILITHCHNDHSPAAEPLKKVWKECKTYAYGPHGSTSGDDGEEADLHFAPDVICSDGDIIKGDSWVVEAVHTPGHTSNHLCFALREEKALLTGDHVMGWSTTVVIPPDGDMTRYVESLEKLLHRDEEIYWPTHGTCITNVKKYVKALLNHRLEREQQILQCLEEGPPMSIRQMVPIMYKDTDKRLHGAAAISALATMTRLVRLEKVKCSTAEMTHRIRTGQVTCKEDEPMFVELFTIAPPL